MSPVSLGSGSLDSHDPARLIGREDELTRLRDVADRAVEHGAQMVLVSGEAGIGKSTLTGAFCDRLHRSGWGVHVGHCIEYADRSVPFGPVVGILRSILLGDVDHVDEIVGERGPDLAGLLPELTEAEAPPSLDGDVDRLFDAIGQTVAASAARRPSVILIEDVHWADVATRDLLAALVHALGTARVLFIVTERSAATDRAHPLRTWLAEMRRLPTVHSIELEGLSRQELEAQAEDLLQEPPDTRLVEELVERTGGNPFFAREILVARRSGSFELPVSLVEFVSSRIRRLDEDERSVLRALAILGGQADHHLLAAMLPDLDVPQRIRSLFDASILEVDGTQFTFGHALLREAILRDVLPFEAEELHRAAAEAISADARRGHSLGDLTALALHWREARDTDRSLAAAVQAAHAAAAVAAYEAAADMSLQALDAWPAATAPAEVAGETRDELLSSALDWLGTCFRGEEAVTLAMDAVAGWAGDLPPDKVGLILAKTSQLHWNLTNTAETARLLAEAVRLVGAAVSTEAAMVHRLAAKQALADGLARPALEAADRSIEIARETGPNRVLVESLGARGLCVGVMGDLEQGLAAVRGARDLAMSENLVAQVAYTYRTEMLILVHEVGRTDACLRASLEGLEYAERHCGPRWRSEFRRDLCVGYLEAGRLVDAEPLLEPLLSSESDDLRRMTVLQAIGLHAIASADYERAHRFLDEADEIAERFQSPQETGYHRRLQAELARREGRLDAALALIDEALELQEECDNLTFTRESVVEKIRTLRAIDERGGADIAPELEAMAHKATEFPDSGQANIAWRALMDVELAFTAGGDVDPDRVRHAVELVEGSGYGFEAAQVRLQLIEQLVASRTVDRSVLEREIEELHEIASACGMVGIRDRVTSLAGIAKVSLQAEELTVPTPPTSDELPHFLTAREVEVMSLLAEGLTNKAIGERLFVSPRTVGTHVSNLIAKLGVSNRGEAAAAYHRLGLATFMEQRERSTA